MTDYTDFLPFLSASFLNDGDTIASELFEPIAKSAVDQALSQVMLESRLMTRRVPVQVMQGQKFIEPPQIDGFLPVGVSAVEASEGFENMVIGLSWDERGIMLPHPAKRDGELILTVELMTSSNDPVYDEKFVTRHHALIQACAVAKMAGMPGRKWFDANSYDLATKNYYTLLAQAVSGHIVSLEPTGLGDYTSILRTLADIALKDTSKASSVRAFKENARNLFRDAMRWVITTMRDYTRTLTVDFEPGVSKYPLDWWGEPDAKVLRYSLSPAAGKSMVTVHNGMVVILRGVPTKRVPDAVHVEIMDTPQIGQDIYDTRYVTNRLHIIAEKAKELMFSQTGQPWHSIVRAAEAKNNVDALLRSYQNPSLSMFKMRSGRITSA